MDPRQGDLMSFSCPHLDVDENRCLKLSQECVPGRKGCVLAGKVVFAVPVEERIREAREAACRRQRNTEATRGPATGDR